MMKEVRYIFFGNTGVGKSTLGNRLLGENVFLTSSAFASTTDEPFSHSNIVNGVKITITDTVGLNDAQVSNDQILKDLSSYLQNDFNGPINYFLLLIKYNEKITIDFVNNLNMLLSSFVGPAPTQNIKIVVTHAKGPAEEQEKKISGLRKQLELSFEKYSPQIKEQVKQIPITVINNDEKKPKNRTPIPPEIDPFLNPPAPIDPKCFNPQGYNLITTTIVQEGFINKRIDEDGIKIHATLVHRKRTEFESFDKKTKTVTKWEDIDGKKTQELNIQYAEYSELKKESTPINLKEGNKTITGNIYHEYKEKRIVQVKFNKIKKQGEPEEKNVPLQNGEVFFELPNTLEIDGRTHIVKDSKSEGELTRIYYDWYHDPDSEKKYEIQEITRPFEEDEIEINGEKIKNSGEEKQKLKIEYKKDPTGNWKKCDEEVVQDWHKTKSTQNITTTETRNQNDTRTEGNSKIQKTWQEKRIVQFQDGKQTKVGDWIKVPNTEKIITTTTLYQDQKIENPDKDYKYDTQYETKYEAVEYVKQISTFKKYREKMEITYINGVKKDETAWKKVPNSEENYQMIKKFEIKGTKDQDYIRRHNNGHGCSGTHYHYFGVNHYTPFYGLEDRYSYIITKIGSTDPIEEYTGKWEPLKLTDDPEKWRCLQDKDGISSEVLKL